MNKQELVGTDGNDKLLPDFTKTETQILESVLAGDTPRVTATRLRIPKSFILTFLNKPKVKEYIRQQKELAAEIVQLKIQGLLTDVLEERIAEVDGDLSQLTKKDTLDVLKLLADISGGIVKGQQQSEAEDKYSLILQQVFK